MNQCNQICAEKSKCKSEQFIFNSTKTSVRGIYNASCTHTTRSSASTNKNAGISIWANSGGIAAGIGEVVQEAIGVIGVFA